MIQELVFTAIRSRGPGGQNVNKVNSASLLKWNFLDSDQLTEEKKDLITSKLENIINKNDQLYVRCDEYRDLERNKARCLEKLEEYLTQAYFKPKKRKKTRPSYSSKLKRLDNKKKRGDVKSTRKKVF